MLIFIIKELKPSGGEVVFKAVTHHLEEVQRPCQQTKHSREIHIYTQTVDEDGATSMDGSLDMTVVTIAEEAVEEAVYMEQCEEQTTGNTLITQEWIEVAVEAEPDSNPNGSFSDAGSEDTVPLVLPSSLPKVVADCVELVFAAMPESSKSTSVAGEDGATAKDIHEEPEDVSADAVLIESTQPEPDVVSPEAVEENSVPSPDEELMKMLINQTPVNQDLLAEELIFTDTSIRRESADEEVIGHDDDDDDVYDDEVYDDEVYDPFERSSSCSEEDITEEYVTEEVPNDPTTTVEPCQPSPVHEAIPESAAEVSTSDEDIVEVETSDVEPDQDEELHTSPAAVNKDVIMNALINALCQELESNDSTSLEPSAENDSLLEEDLCLSTVFVPLCGQPEVTDTNKDPDEMTEESIEILSNELKAENPEEIEVTISEEEHQTITTGISENCEVTVDEDEDVPGASKLCDAAEQGERISTGEASVEDPGKVVSEGVEITGNAESTENHNSDSEEPAEEEERQPKSELLVLVDDRTEDSLCETDNSDSDSSTSHTIDEESKATEPILEDVNEGEAEGGLVTSEEVEPKVTAEEETVESETKANAPESPAGSYSIYTCTSMTSRHVEALCGRLQAACTSVVEDSVLRPVVKEMLSLGYSITVTVNVAPKTGQ